MIKILLDIASNGVIKTVVDNNINGAGDKLERKSVYNFEDDETFEKRIYFLHELCDELGIETGNKYDRNTLIFKTDWGKQYNPTVQELNDRIKRCTNELKTLKLIKSRLDDNRKEV